MSLEHEKYRKIIIGMLEDMEYTVESIISDNIQIKNLFVGVVIKGVSFRAKVSKDGIDSFITFAFTVTMNNINKNGIKVD